MSNYKRLTNNNSDEYDAEYDFCCGCQYFGEPCGCNRPNSTCDSYDRFLETYDRLAELEDKIENGTLVEQNEWISVKDKLPNYDEKVLVYVPKRDGCSQNGIFTANYKPIKADDGRGNFWRVPTEACEWTVWSWSYFEHPVVTHWIPFPIPPTEAEAKLKE